MKSKLQELKKYKKAVRFEIPFDDVNFSKARDEEMECEGDPCDMSYTPKDLLAGLKKAKTYINSKEKKLVDGKEEIMWFSPAMIPYESYNNDYIYYDDNIKTDVEVLNNKEDYEKAAELIYNSEPIAYKNLFGSLDNAKKILPVLFENEQSNFYKGNYYVLKNENDIIAIIALYKSIKKWNNGYIEKAFIDAGITPPETINDAQKSFGDTFEDSINDMYMLNDLCVAEEYSGKRFGKYLFLYANNIAKRENRNTIFTVYADNKVAIKMYTDLGAIKFLSDFDNRGEGKKFDKEYYKMVMYNVV